MERREIGYEADNLFVKFFLVFKVFIRPSK